jgi:hypothetical protein
VLIKFYTNPTPANYSAVVGVYGAFLEYEAENFNDRFFRDILFACRQAIAVTGEALFQKVSADPARSSGSAASLPKLNTALDTLSRRRRW